MELISLRSSVHTHSRSLCVLVSSGDALLDVESAREMETGSPPTEHFTVLFTTFVLMTLFNEINSRKLHGERNVFAGLHTNPLFLGIWVSTFLVQVRFYCTYFTLLYIYISNILQLRVSDIFVQ